MNAKLLTVISILFLLSLSSEVSVAMVSWKQSLLMQGETSKTRKVRLGFGYVVLPDDYRAYQTDDLRDAWYGYIASPSKDSIRIRYTAGLVESPFQDGGQKFVWLKSESNDGTLLKFGLLKKENGGQMAARVGIVNFYANLDGEAQMELFLKIIRSYRIKPCDDCEPVFQKPAIEQALGADSPVSSFNSKLRERAAQAQRWMARGGPKKD